MASKIAIFYHVFQHAGWKQLYHDQIYRLQKSGLYDAADYIHIGVNGSYRMPFNLIKENVVVKRNANVELVERDTMLDLYEFCVKNPDYKVMYMHTKGLTWFHSPEYAACSAWRDYLERFVIDTWKVCVEKLDSHDTAGTEMSVGAPHGVKVEGLLHYSGNFWWANASYIAKLNKNYLDDAPYGRFNSEFFVGTGNPEYFNFTNVRSIKSNLIECKNFYDSVVKYSEYSEVLNSYTKNQKAKLGMISMFKNEAKNIRKMLDSVTPHISYWVLQDNGSTDGTPDIVNQWAEETQIPGFMYKVDEGWVGFGWNRDHVLQRFLSSPHNCDWLMKMDCDETLVIDPDFDWQIFNDNPDAHAFHVQAEAPNIVYYRAWLWNTKYPWHFKHDPAHETIVLDIDEIGEDFQRINLPQSFKMLAGESYGESYTVPTKYLSDALKLEEKMLRENTLLQDTYHFWYIGKSYCDAYVNADLPLKKIHQDEYARRCIFYFKEYVNYMHDYENTRKAKNIDEMSYFGMTCIGNAYRFIGDIEKSIQYLKEAEQFCPRRNEHLVSLIHLYDEIGEYAKMLECAEILMKPERTCPFPDHIFIIATYLYHDKSSYPSYLYNLALDKNRK